MLMVFWGDNSMHMSNIALLEISKDLGFAKNAMSIIRDL